MWLFLVSKTLGVALLPRQKFLSEFINHRGIGPRLLLTVSRGAGEEVEEKAQPSSDLGCRRNWCGLLWRSCEVRSWGITRPESQPWRSRGPASWPWRCSLTSLFWPSPGSFLWEHGSTELLLLRGAWGPPFIPLPHATPCESVRLETCREASSGAWPQTAMGPSAFTSMVGSWQTHQPQCRLVSPRLARKRCSPRSASGGGPAAGCILRPRVQRAGRADMITEQR